MKVYINEQARNYLDRLASGQPVKPDVSGFFWSDIESGWLTFKAGAILEFWIEPTQQAALNRLTQ